MLNCSQEDRAKMAAGKDGFFFGISLLIFIVSFRQNYAFGYINDSGLPQQLNYAVSNDMYIQDAPKNIDSGNIVCADLILSFRQEASDHNGVNKTQHSTFSSSVQLLIIALIRSGDIHPHPGPRVPKHPCTVCDKGVTARSKAVECDQCFCWTHIKCTEAISIPAYNQAVLENYNLNFICDRCTISTLPFLEKVIPEDVPQHDFSTVTASGNTEQIDINMLNFSNTKGLHFLHLNIRSLLPKISELRFILQNAKPAVLCITESWLDNSVSDNEIKIDGYSVIRKDRDRSGGGVCMYINNRFAFNPREDLHRDSMESIWIDILLPKTRPITVETCYRPPKESFFGKL